MIQNDYFILFVHYNSKLFAELLSLLGGLYFFLNNIIIVQILFLYLTFVFMLCPRTYFLSPPPQLLFPHLPLSCLYTSPQSHLLSPTILLQGGSALIVIIRWHYFKIFFNLVHLSIYLLSSIQICVFPST